MLVSSLYYFGMTVLCLVFLLFLKVLYRYFKAMKKLTFYRE